jgi:phytoene synthase
VARQGFDSVSRRAVVSGRRKAALLARSLGAIALPAGTTDAPCLAETRFLVEAVAAEPRRLRPATPDRRLGERVGWMLDLMLRLEQERPLSGGMR